MRGLSTMDSLPGRGALSTTSVMTPPTYSHRLASAGKSILDATHRLRDTVAHRRRKHERLAGLLMRFFSSCLLIGLAYCALYLSIKEPFYYGGPAWSAMLIWAAAQGAGWVFGVMRLPALLGMLLIGLILRNAAPGSISGLPSSWSQVLRVMALGTIFLRSGLELDVKVFKRVGPAAVRLLLIPGLTEAAVTGALAHPVLGLPVLWGFTLGFILKAVGPAIIITLCYELQKQRLGVAKGIPSILVAAASFDDMVAITGYGLFSNFAFAHGDKALGWQIAHGPVEIVLGAVGGIIGGLFCSLTVLWRTRFQRTAAAFMTGLALVFTFYKYEMRSAGPLAALVTGMVLRVCMDSGRPAALSLGPKLEYAQQIERDLGVFWRWVAQPLLFGIIGTMVNLRGIKDPSLIPRALALIITGLVVRAPVSFMAVAGAGLTTLERLFIAVAWTPKATVQAALGPLPLDTILSKEGPDSPNIEFAEAILTTSVLAILVCGTLGVMGVHICAPRWLARGGDPSPGTEAHKLWLAQLNQLGQQRTAEAGGSSDDVREAGRHEPSSSGGAARIVSGGGSSGLLRRDIPDLLHAVDNNHDETRSNESYDGWRTALQDAISTTRLSLAGLLGSAATLLPRQRQRRHRAPAARMPFSSLHRNATQEEDNDKLADLPQSVLMLCTSPSAPPVMQTAPGLGMWPGLGWAGMEPAAPENTPDHTPDHTPDNTPDNTSNNAPGNTVVVPGSGEGITVGNSSSQAEATPVDGEGVTMGSSNGSSSGGQTRAMPAGRGAPTGYSSS